MTSTLEGEKESFALNSLEDKLVTALKKKDSRALCERLFEKCVIGREVEDKFSSLDHVHLKEELKVRYLVQNIYDAVKDNKLVYHSFVDVLTEVDEGVVSELNKELHHHKLSEVLEDSQVGTSKALVGSKRPRTNIGEVRLCESDVPLLTELLADGANRAEELGVALHLTKSQIKKCAKDCSIKMCLSHVILEWIRSTEEGCTLNSIKTALKSALVALPDVVSGLEEKFTNEAQNIVHKKQCLDFERHFPKYRSGDITVTRGKSALLCYQVSPFQVSYEWKKNMQPLPEGDVYIGTHSPVLFINGEGQDTEGEYECIVFKDGQCLCSEKANLTFLALQESKFTMYFSSFYSVKKEIPKDSWPPVKADKFISLALINNKKKLRQDYSYSVLGDVDDIIADKVKVEFEEEFGKYESGSLILLEGRPGSGKTTLMHKISRDWSLGKSILFKAEMVILVPIRFFVIGNKDIALSNILKRYVMNKDERKQLLLHIEKGNGKGICFLIDGLDEYEQHDNFDTFIMKLIIKDVLPLSMVVVASRPVGTASVRNHCTRRVEILGFKRDQISEYIISYFYEKRQKSLDLLSYLKSHVNVHRLCYLPVHAAMICFLYDNQGDKIPQTESKIYEAFTLFSVVRKRDQKHRTKSFISLPDDQKIYFNNICKLAFDMIVQSKQVMLQSQTNFPLTPSGSDKSSLGLVTIDSIADLFGMEDLYSFLHLTFQEYLAAFYLSQLDSESEVIRKTKGLKVNLRMVWKFYSGIVQFDKDSLILKSLMSDNKTDVLYKVQCAFESQQQIACDMLLELSEDPNSLCFSKNNFIATDFLAMSYVIETSHIQVTKLFFQKCILDSEGVDIFLEKLSTAKLDNIRYMGFNKKNCNLSQLNALFNILNKIQHGIETLDLESIDISRSGIIKLFQNLEFSNLHSLKIYLQLRNTNQLKLPIASKVQYVEYSSYETMYYEHHFYRIGTLTENYCTAVHYNYHFEMLSYCCNPINVMPKTNMELFQRCRKLILINCGITDKVLSELMNIFNYFVNVDTIHLDFNKLNFENCVLPSDTSEVFKNLRYFSAQCNSIQDSGAISLAKLLNLASTKLEKLDLQGNPITDKGVETIKKIFGDFTNFNLLCSDSSKKLLLREMQAIAFKSKEVETSEAAYKCLNHVEELCVEERFNFENLKYLKYCSNLKKIKISLTLLLPCIIALAEGLKSFTNLQTLDLSLNKIGSDCATALAGGLKSCTNLQTLDLCFNKIGSKGATVLAGGLKSCTNLQTLDLGSNIIGSDGATALAESLKSCTNLQTLDLRFNKIGSKGATALAEGLKSYINLQKLDLESNMIGLNGARALAEGLKSCTNLQTLQLGSNSMGSDGATALAEGLKSCTNLQTLDLRFNKIGSKGATALAEGLKSYTNLQKLDLESNMIGLNGARALAEGLKSCTNLQTLQLGSNSMGSDGATALAEGLKSCTNLQTLYLASNNIGSDGATALAQGLKSCTNLQTLQLGSNSIGSDGATALADGLKSCTNLQTLNLYSNKIGLDGATALAEGLKSYTNL